ncbi:MAG: hypothetical protein AAFW00_21870 [Bacteroidota bacterium]
MNFKATRLALLSLFVLSLTFSSCNPLRPILMILEGDWDVKSFTEDGVETMGTIFTSVQIEFEEYGETEGETNWTFLATTGVSTIVTGDYQLNDDGTEVEISFKSGSLTGEIVDFDLELQDSDMELSGNIDGFRWVIDAEKD